jgi:hypothetical protein
MSFFGRILCAFDRHDPVRRKVRWDGGIYVGECRRCGASIYRISRRTWRRAKPATNPDETPAS